MEIFTFVEFDIKYFKLKRAKTVIILINKLAYTSLIRIVLVTVLTMTFETSEFIYTVRIITASIIFCAAFV